jgi:hypothetical protein
VCALGNQTYSRVDGLGIRTAFSIFTPFDWLDHEFRMGTTFDRKLLARNIVSVEAKFLIEKLSIKLLSDAFLLFLKLFNVRSDSFKFRKRY